MNTLRILQSIEDLVYEVALWIIFIPRTFVKVLRDPLWAYSYVDAEFRKETSKRFEHYIPPLLFWITTGLIPYLLLFDYLKSIAQSRIAQESEWSQFLQLPWETRLLIVAVFALAGPLGFSALIQKAKRESIDRETLKRTFYTQCLCFTPATCFLLPFVAITLRFNDDIPSGSMETIFSLSFLAFLCWTLYAETVIIRAELNVKWFKALARSLWYLFASYWLFFFLELIVLTLALGLQFWK